MLTLTGRCYAIPELSQRRNKTKEYVLNHSRWAHVYCNRIRFEDQRDPVLVFGCPCGNPRSEFCLAYARDGAAPGSLPLSAFNSTLDMLGAPCKHAQALSSCSIEFDNVAPIEDIPAVAQLEGSDIKVSVGLPDTAYKHRAVWEQTAQGWRCLECDKKTACAHANFLRSEISLQADLAALVGSINTKAQGDRKSWSASPIGLRQIDVDIVGDGWDKSGAVFERAAHGLNTLSGTHRAIPPTSCACSKRSSAAEEKSETKRCSCGVCCPKCGAAWRSEDRPDSDVRFSSCQPVVMLRRSLFIIVASRGRWQRPNGCAQTPSATASFSGTVTTSLFFATPTESP